MNVLVIMGLMSLWLFVSMFDAQTIVSVSSIELSETSLKISHDNKTNECALQDPKRPSFLCPNVIYLVKNDTHNVQLTSPLNMFQFYHNHYTMYISEITYDDYFCMIEFNVADMSCTRIMIHHSGMEECLIEMLSYYPIPDGGSGDECIDSRYKKKQNKIMYGMIDLFIAFLILLFSIDFIYLAISLRKRRENEVFLRKLYLPIRRNNRRCSDKV